MQFNSGLFKNNYHIPKWDGYSKGSEQAVYISKLYSRRMGFLGGARGKKKKKKQQPANAPAIRDMGSIPGSGRTPGGGHGTPLRYLCLENPVDRGAWQMNTEAT